MILEGGKYDEYDECLLYDIWTFFVAYGMEKGSNLWLL